MSELATVGRRCGCGGRVTSEIAWLEQFAPGGRSPQGGKKSKIMDVPISFASTLIYHDSSKAFYMRMPLVQISQQAVKGAAVICAEHWLVDHTKVQQWRTNGECELR